MTFDCTNSFLCSHELSLGAILDSIKAEKPLVHCITNYVTVNDVANIILAVGALPVMAHDVKETAEITANANCLVLNLGATEYYEAMKISAQTASSLGIPIIVDPVGAGASTYRRNFCYELLENCNVTAVRGNHAEIAALISNKKTARGVDSSDSFSFDKLVSQGSRSEFEDRLKGFAESYGVVLAASGSNDFIISPSRVVSLEGGSSMMSLVTGTGCMSAGVLGAFAGGASCLLSGDFDSGAAFDVTYASSQFMKTIGGLANSKVIEREEGPSSFKTHLIDFAYLAR